MKNFPAIVSFAIFWVLYVFFDMSWFAAFAISWVVSVAIRLVFVSDGQDSSN